MCIPLFRKKKQPMVYDYYPQPAMGYANKYDKHGGYSKEYKKSKKYKKQRKYDHIGSAAGEAAGFFTNAWGGSGGDGGGGGGSGGCDGGGGGGGGGGAC
ncbi:hypothetical protein FSHL1_005035 [Fusarium sambucinum]